MPVYDLLNRLLSFGMDQHWRRVAARRVDGGLVLDLACGTGDLSIALSRRSRVVGSDILPEMLAVARRKAKAIPFAASDGEHLSFRDDAFDAVTIAFGIRNFSNRKAGLREMARVLTPNGRLVILEFAIPSNVLFKNLYLFYFLKVLPFVGKMISRNSRSYSYLPESVLGFPEPLQFIEEIRSCGFTDLSTEAMTFGIVRIYSARASKMQARSASSKGSPKAIS